MNIEHNIVCLLGETIRNTVKEYNDSGYVTIDHFEVCLPNLKRKSIIKQLYAELLKLANSYDNWLLSPEIMTDIQVCTMVITNKLYTDRKLFKYIKKHGLNATEECAYHCAQTVNKLFGDVK
jgi:hypothetical protein